MLDCNLHLLNWFKASFDLLVLLVCSELCSYLPQFHHFNIILLSTKKQIHWSIAICTISSFYYCINYKKTKYTWASMRICVYRLLTNTSGVVLRLGEAPRPSHIDNRTWLHSTQGCGKWGIAFQVCKLEQYTLLFFI